MVTTWVVYCLLISGLLGLAAFAGERALGHYRKPVRWVWVGVIVGSIAVPVFAFLAPALFRAMSLAMSADMPITISPSQISPVAAVPVGDAAALADALKAVLHDPAGAQRRATAAAEEARARFDQDGLTERIWQVYLDLVESVD